MARVEAQAIEMEAMERGPGKSRAGWVFDRLKQQIQAGKYGRGDRVRESEVAAALGVSRTPVREALARLQAAGLLELAGGGLVVAQLNRSHTVELYAMREILEGSAARFAAQHATPSEIANLHHLATQFSHHLDDPARLARINMELHDAIYQAAHNRYLLRTLGEIHDALALLPGTTFSVKGRPPVAVKEHAAIVKAIEKRDPDAAEVAARQHIARAQEARLTLLSDLR